MREIVLEGPGKNALSTALMQKTLAALAEAEDDAVLLTGHGDTFSAGLHLKEISALDDEGLTRYLETLDDLVLALYEHPAPVVALINGHAIAGGCVLALCADLRIATADPKARIGLNEVALGLDLPPRILKLARARIAPHALDRVLLEGGLYPPEVACRLGLVDEVSDDAATLARTICERLASHPRETYRTMKRAVRDGVLTLHASEILAFREEKLPVWLTRRGLLGELLKR